MDAELPGRRPSAERRRFVVISGLPGSGKTTLARRLAPALDLPLIDKDDILERLFAAKGTGDAEWRRALSRESDRILQQEAMASAGAVLSSFWRVPGMPPESGTPTDWIPTLSSAIVHVHCVCAPEVAARRFVQRRRHAGHLDSDASHAEVLADLERLATLGPPDLSPRIDVDTAQEPELHDVVRAIRHALGIPG